MAETRLVRRILKALQDKGAWAYKAHGGGYSRGLPDIIVCYRGRFLGLEVKDPAGRYAATPLQLYTIDEIRKHGGTAAVVYSVDEVLNLLQWLDEFM